jgi:hypothetical protein
LPILFNTIIIKIDPRCKEFAMVIPQAHGFGDAVTQGHHLHVLLYCQKPQVCNSQWRKFDHRSPKNNSNDDKSSAVISGSTPT